MVVFTSWILGLIGLSSVYSVAAHPSKNGFNVTWTACADYKPPFECATLDVPLDWGDRSQGLIPLSMIRLPASVQPCKGFMFYNPGGPGGSGLSFVGKTGYTLQKQLGGSWDVVSWDPRGVGKSGPNITTFLNDDEFGQWLDQTQGIGHLDTHGNLTVKADADFFISKAPVIDNMAKTLNTIQQEKNGKNMTYIGSVAVVRDLVAMADAIYGQGVDINFWGISYGTIIGTYLTQMFPHRIGHVILDGVYDPVAQSNELPSKWIDTDVADIEAAFIGWAEACVAAGPSKCPISAKGNNTAEGIHRLFEEALDIAYHNYDGTVWDLRDLLNGTKAAELYANPNHTSFAVISDQMRGLLYNTETWEYLGIYLERLITPVTNSTHLMTRSAESVIPLWLRRSNPAYYGVRGMGNVFPETVLKAVFFAIHCSDTIDPQHEAPGDFFRSVVSASQRISRNFASAMSIISLRGFCHHLTARAVERLPQKMNKKPKNVVLVIGNSADPVTPFQSARKIASAAHLGSQARLVKFNAVGHSSLSNSMPPALTRSVTDVLIQDSTCIDDVVRKYLNNMPPADLGNDDADVECNPDGGSPFGKC